jgi:hypothetical protein
LKEAVCYFHNEIEERIATQIKCGGLSLSQQEVKEILEKVRQLAINRLKKDMIGDTQSIE